MTFSLGLGKQIRVGLEIIKNCNGLRKIMNRKIIHECGCMLHSFLQ